MTILESLSMTIGFFLASLSTVLEALLILVGSLEICLVLFLVMETSIDNFLIHCSPFGLNGFVEVPG